MVSLDKVHLHHSLWSFSFLHITLTFSHCMWSDLQQFLFSFTNRPLYPFTVLLAPSTTPNPPSTRGSGLITGDVLQSAMPESTHAFGHVVHSLSQCQNHITKNQVQVISMCEKLSFLVEFQPHTNVVM